MTGDDALNRSVVEIGPKAVGDLPRWTRRADVPERPLPDRPNLTCHRAGGSSTGRQMADMRTGEPTALASRVSLEWDESHLHVLFEFEDPSREATMTEPRSHVYQRDTTAEVFVSGPAGYYEVGVNSIGTHYEVGWTWVEPLIESRAFTAIDGLFRLPNFLYYAPQGSQRIGRVGDLDFELDGLDHTETWIDSDSEPGWTSSIALPWSSLAGITGLPVPATPGLEFGLQAMRVNPKETESDYWAVSVQGNANVHNTERWARVTLAD